MSQGWGALSEGPGSPRFGELCLKDQGAPGLGSPVRRTRKSQAPPLLGYDLGKQFHAFVPQFTLQRNEMLRLSETQMKRSK